MRGRDRRDGPAVVRAPIAIIAAPRSGQPGRSLGLVSMGTTGRVFRTEEASPDVAVPGKLLLPLVARFGNYSAASIARHFGSDYVKPERTPGKPGRRTGFLSQQLHHLQRHSLAFPRAWGATPQLPGRRPKPRPASSFLHIPRKGHSQEQPPRHLSPPTQGSCTSRSVARAGALSPDVRAPRPRIARSEAP